MTSHEPADPGKAGVINLSVMVRALAYPLFVWVVLAGGAILSGQPGVICITPMAWLLATWCGLRYASVTAGQPGLHPLLGAALAGALLGVGEGIFFILVIAFSAPPATPDDVIKTQILDLVIFVAGVIFCAGLSMFTAWLRMNRLARQR